MAAGAEYWTKVAALGQVAGAVATFAAVVVSLYLALHARKPRVKIRVGERLLIGGHPAQDDRFLMFSVANLGERPVHVRSVGWRTGWLPWGPKWIKRQHAVQLTDVAGFGSAVPFELGIGEELSTYASMAHVLTYASERKEDPLFSRDYPWVGRRATRVLGTIYTATGHTIHVTAEKSLVKALVAAERRALEAHTQAQ